MNSKTITSLVNMCRTCMSQCSKSTNHNVFTNKHSICEVLLTAFKSDASIMEILQLIQPQIKVDIEDNLPTFICSDCIEKLIMTYEFIEMYRIADNKFRSMLREANNLNKNKNNVSDLKDSLEIINENNNLKELVRVKNEDGSIEVTKYEFLIEKLNIEEIEKTEDSDNCWENFEDHPLYEMSEHEAVDRDLFLNPYSDASDSEWMPTKKRQKATSKKGNRQEYKDQFEIIDSTSTQTSSNKIATKRITKKEKHFEEFELLQENKNGSRTCLECQTVLDNIELWKKHIQSHRSEKESKRKNIKSSKTRKNAPNPRTFECEHCGKGFSKTTAYKIHLRVHSGKEPYLCNECGKSFKSVSSLNTHMLRHKGEKTILCPHCPRKFVCASGLYGHMMVHKKDKPFVCDICGSAFHMAYQLRKHNLYHNGVKNYQCEYCDMKFVTSEKQRRHMRTHTGEKPYRCKYCDKAFAQSNDCVKHLKQHLGDNVYQCELCPLRFPLARDLRVHFATHKDDNEETRTRNLEARLEEEKKLQIKLGCKETGES